MTDQSGLLNAIDTALKNRMQEHAEAVMSGRVGGDPHKYGLLIGQFNGLKEAREVVVKAVKSWEREERDDE